MLDVEKIRQDFPMLNGATMHGQPLIYFDNGATTLKPQCVIDAVCNYLTNYSGNAHRGDYDLSHDVDTQFEKTRDLVAKLINCDRKEVDVDILNRFEDGTEVTPAALLASGAISKLGDGVKLLGNGELTKKLNVKVNAVSESAKAKIEAAGGTVEVI